MSWPRLPARSAAGAFALDMEFERERSYWPKLQLVQVAVPNLVAAIDPLALEDLSPLYDLIADPAIEKITHAGRQDAEIFFLKTGKAPAGIYDTQIAAALVGLGEQVGYAMLVQRLLGVRVIKHERVTDWGRRPLSEAQLEYALNDVRHLLQIRDALNADLRELGRETWFREETAFYSDPDLYRHDPDRLYMKVSRWRSLDRRGLGVLRELVGWREEDGRRRDLPRQRVVPDDVMIELASRRPKRVSDLSPLRRLHPKEIERGGDAIVAAVGRGLALPEAQLPNPPKAPSRGSRRIAGRRPPRRAPAHARPRDPHRPVVPRHSEGRAGAGQLASRQARRTAAASLGGLAPRRGRQRPRRGLRGACLAPRGCGGRPGGGGAFGARVSPSLTYAHSQARGPRRLHRRDSH